MSGTNMLSGQIKKRTAQVQKAFDEIKKLDENELSHLYELVSLHNKLLFLVGDLEAEAKFERDEAYRERKRVDAEIKLKTNGTGVVKESTAELAIQEYRMTEHEADRVYTRFRNQYKAIDHRLIDYRQKRNKLEHELSTVNDKG